MPGEQRHLLQYCQIMSEDAQRWPTKNKKQATTHKETAPPLTQQPFKELLHNDWLRQTNMRLLQNLPELCPTLHNLPDAVHYRLVLLPTHKDRHNTFHSMSHCIWCSA
jgi:hypothetical protein